MTNAEQGFYDTLKKKSDKDLIDRAEQIEIEQNDLDIELGMIRFLLINRGKTKVPGHFVTDFVYGRFYQR